MTRYLPRRRMIAKKKMSVNSERIRRLDRARLMSSGRSGTVRSSSNGSMAKVNPMFCSRPDSILCARARISSWKRGKLRAKCGRSTKISTPMPGKDRGKEDDGDESRKPEPQPKACVQQHHEGIDEVHEHHGEQEGDHDGRRQPQDGTGEEYHHRHEQPVCRAIRGCGRHHHQRPERARDVKAPTYSVGRDAEGRRAQGRAKGGRRIWHRLVLCRRSSRGKPRHLVCR